MLATNPDDDTDATSNAPSEAPTIRNELETTLNIYIMQYDQKIKIGNKRNIEATERAIDQLEALFNRHTASSNLEARIKGRLSGLKSASRYKGNFFEVSQKIYDEIDNLEAQLKRSANDG